MANAENVCPQTARSVARELQRLAARPPAGIKLQLREDDLTDVLAYIDGPGECRLALSVLLRLRACHVILVASALSILQSIR